MIHPHLSHKSHMNFFLLFSSYRYLSVLLACITFALSCTNSSPKGKSTSEPATETGWTELFNGENLDGWYTYQMRPEPTSEVAGLARDEENNLYLHTPGSETLTFSVERSSCSPKVLRLSTVKLKSKASRKFRMSSGR